MKTLLLILTLLILAGCNGMKSQLDSESQLGKSKSIVTATIDPWVLDYMILGGNPTSASFLTYTDNRSVYLQFEFNVRNLSGSDWYDYYYDSFEWFEYRLQIRPSIRNVPPSLYIENNSPFSCVRVGGETKVAATQFNVFHTTVGCELTFSQVLTQCHDVDIVTRGLKLSAMNSIIPRRIPFGPERIVTARICPNIIVPPTPPPTPTPVPNPTPSPTPTPNPTPNPVPPTNPAPISGYLSLQSAGGSYVTAENGGGGEVLANRTIIGAWEKFGYVDLNGGALDSGDQIQLRVDNGMEFARGSGNIVYADTYNGEVFTIQKTSGSGPLYRDDQVTLKASNGKFVAAEDGGGSILRADRDLAQSWETFRLISDSVRPPLPAPVWIPVPGYSLRPGAYSYYPDTDAKELKDGVSGTANHLDPAWVGVIGQPTYYFLIGITPPPSGVKSAILRVLRSQASGIYVPGKVQLFCGTALVKEWITPADNTDGVKTIVLNDWPVCSYPHLRLWNGWWTFISEITVLAN